MREAVTGAVASEVAGANVKVRIRVRLRGIRGLENPSIPGNPGNLADKNIRIV